MRITPFQMQEMLARLERNRKRDVPDEPKVSKAVERESVLHQQIVDECRRRRYYVVHSRMDRATTQAVGTPDFIVALPGGRTVWIEVKAKGAKLKPAQTATQAWLKCDGHTALTVWSFEEFLDLIKKMDIA